MKVEVQLHQRKRRPDFVEVFEDKNGLLRLVTSGDSPQHHALIRNLYETFQHGQRWKLKNVENGFVATSI